MCWRHRENPWSSYRKSRWANRKHLTKTHSVSASPRSLHLGDNGAETKAHLLFSLGALLQHIAFIWDGGDVFVPSAFPYQPRLGFLCRCCGAFSLAVVASKINILLMLARSREIHCLKAATCFATHKQQKSPLVILCTRGEELWMKIRADWKIVLALPIRRT